MTDLLRRTVSGLRLVYCDWKSASSAVDFFLFQLLKLVRSTEASAFFGTNYQSLMFTPDNLRHSLLS